MRIPGPTRETTHIERYCWPVRCTEPSGARLGNDQSGREVVEAGPRSSIRPDIRSASSSLVALAPRLKTPVTGQFVALEGSGDGLGVANVNRQKPEQGSVANVKTYDPPHEQGDAVLLPGSHPAVSVKLMLDYKGIDFKTIDLMPCARP